jgi:hypothetical protein
MAPRWVKGVGRSGLLPCGSSTPRWRGPNHGRPYHRPGIGLTVAMQSFTVMDQAFHGKDAAFEIEHHFYKY